MSGCDKNPVFGTYTFSTWLHPHFVRLTRHHFFAFICAQNIYRYHASKNSQYTAISDNISHLSKPIEISSDKMWPSLQDRLKTTFVKETW
jgi:hypothetical protein